MKKKLFDLPEWQKKAKKNGWGKRKPKGLKWKMTTYKKNIRLIEKLIVNLLKEENSNYAYVTGYLKSLIASNMTTEIRKSIEYKIKN